jgi:hypothetical protein
VIKRDAADKKTQQSYVLAQELFSNFASLQVENVGIAAHACFMPRQKLSVSRLSQPDYRLAYVNDEHAKAMDEKDQLYIKTVHARNNMSVIIRSVIVCHECNNFL